MSGTLNTYDTLAVTAALMLFLAYHLDIYYVKPKFLGRQPPFAGNIVNVKLWLLNHKEKSNESQEKGNLLAVQTVRNTMKAGVFIGGKALYITYLVSNGYSDMYSQRSKVRSLTISVLMFCSFLCWANVIRLGSSVGYYLGVLKYSEQLRSKVAMHETQCDNTITIVAEQEFHLIPSAGSSKPLLMEEKQSVRRNGVSENIATDFSSPDIPDALRECITMLRMMMVFSSVGFRLMFISIPFAFYSAGPTALLVTSVGMFLFLYFIDRSRYSNSKIKKQV